MERSRKIELVIVGDATFCQVVAVSHLADGELGGWKPILGLFIREAIDQRQVVLIRFLAILGLITPKCVFNLHRRIGNLAHGFADGLVEGAREFVFAASRGQRGPAMGALEFSGKLAGLGIIGLSMNTTSLAQLGQVKTSDQTT